MSLLKFFKVFHLYQCNCQRDWITLLPQEKYIKISKVVPKINTLLQYFFVRESSTHFPLTYVEIMHFCVFNFKQKVTSSSYLSPALEKLTHWRKFGHLAPHKERGRPAKSWDFGCDRTFSDSLLLIGVVKRILCECVCVAVSSSPRV